MMVKSDIDIRGRVYHTDTSVEIRVRNGHIDSIRRLVGQVERPIVAPAFIDMQVNGFGGHDFSAADLGIEDVQRIVESLAASGTTRLLPTIISAPRERILRNLRLIVEARNDSAEIAHAIVGIHLEGPWISPDEGPRGAHDRAYVRHPNGDDLVEWVEASEGLLRVITLAPELPGAIEVIKAATDRGILVSIGHTAASPAQIRQAIDAGARMSTHLGNGSHAMLPRLENYLWEQLAAEELTACIIADGFHLPPAVVRVISGCKRRDRLVLVSDVAPLGGLPPGRYKWDRIDVEVDGDGRLGLADTPFLAGSGYRLDRCIARFLTMTGWTIDEALRLCVDNPAHLLGLPIPPEFHRKTSTVDLIVCDWREETGSLALRLVTRQGQVLYAEGEAA